MNADREKMFANKSVSTWMAPFTVPAQLDSSSPQIVLIV